MTHVKKGQLARPRSGQVASRGIRYTFPEIGAGPPRIIRGIVHILRKCQLNGNFTEKLQLRASNKETGK